MWECKNCRKLFQPLNLCKECDCCTRCCFNTGCGIFMHKTLREVEKKNETDKTE